MVNEMRRNEHRFMELHTQEHGSESVFVKKEIILQDAAQVSECRLLQAVPCRAMWIFLLKCNWWRNFYDDTIKPNQITSKISVKLKG